MKRPLAAAVQTSTTIAIRRLAMVFIPRTPLRCPCRKRDRLARSCSSSLLQQESSAC
jgi:hypothetical protein